jgi:hypothetical protein
MKLKVSVATVFAIALMLVPFDWVVRANEPALTIDGTHFKVNGSQKFLVFVSYQDAIDAGANTDRDFKQLKALGVDGVRIWPNWFTKATFHDLPTTYAGDTVIDSDGGIREGPWEALVDIIDKAGQYGLLVDLTFSGDTVGEGNAVGDGHCDNLQLSLEDDRDAIAEVAYRLSGSGYEHVLFDLQNESNIRGPLCNPLDDSDVAALVTAVKNVDSSRLVTASVDFNINESNSAAPAGARADSSGQDMVAYHEERTGSGWYDAYDDIVYQIHSEANIPVYLQEPAKHEGGLLAQDFRDALSAAVSAGAAAWTFHSDAGSCMNGWSECVGLLENLDDVERDFLVTFRAGDVDNLLVRITTVSDYFFGYNGSQGVATATGAGSLQTFVLINHDHSGGALFDGDHVSFHLDSGDYYQAEDGGGDDGKTLLANSSNPYSWETFVIHNLTRCHKNGGNIPNNCGEAIMSGDEIALETDGGRYVTAINGGNDNLDADRTQVQSWETFHFWVHY